MIWFVKLRDGAQFAIKFPVALANMMMNYVNEEQVSKRNFKSDDVYK